MKKSLLVLLMILTMAVLSGCGMTEEEASEYVKASLDAAYKGEFEVFVEITDSTPEGAQAMYEENIVHTMEAAGFSEMKISDELTDKYKQLFLDILKIADYSVGEAHETENGEFEVSVEITPLKIFDEISEDKVSEAVISRIDKMKKYPGDKKITEITFEEIYEILSEELKEPSYGEEAIDHTVTVHKNEKGMYYISEEDMLTLDSALFAVE